MKTQISTTNDIGPVIKAAREARKMSLIHVANKAGFTYMTVHNIENNKGSTRTETLIAVASVVGVTLELVSEKI